MNLLQRSPTIYPLLAAVLFCLCLTSCKTKSEIRREQELEQLKQQVQSVQGTKADEDEVLEELKTKITRIANVAEEGNAANAKSVDDLKKQIDTLNTRVQALEQRAVAADAAEKQAAADRAKASYANAKKLYDDEKYDQAEDMLKAVISREPKSEDGKRAQFLLGESYFADKDFASAALAYSAFRKEFPKDSLAPNAVYQLAQSFKQMGQKKNAKLFFREVVENYPRSPFAAKARRELHHKKS